MNPLSEAAPLAAVTASPVAVPVPAAAQASLDQAVLKYLGLGQLRPSPTQPRRWLPEEELRRLGQDMLARGLLVPLIVNPGDAPDTYTIFDGHRRAEAARLVGIETLLCMVVLPGSNGQRFEDQLSTTLQRADLRPSERAQAFQKLLDSKGTAKRVAEDLHVSEATISIVRHILDVPSDLWPHIDDGTLTLTHVRQLAKLKDPERQRARAQEIMARRAHGKAAQPKTAAVTLKCQVGPIHIALRGAGGLTVEQADAALTELSRDLKKMKGRPLRVVQQFLTTKQIAQEATAAVEELSRPAS